MKEEDRKRINALYKRSKKLHQGRLDDASKVKSKGLMKFLYGENNRMQGANLDMTKKKIQKDFDRDKDLLLSYGVDAPKARSFMSKDKKNPLGMNKGGKVMKMRGGGMATQGTKFSIR